MVPQLTKPKEMNGNGAITVDANCTDKRTQANLIDGAINDTNASCNEPIIRLPKGFVKGKICMSALGETYYSFQGLRYAKPPIGKLRFKAPQDLEPWEGVYDATKEGSPCIALARNNDEIVGSEDCLFINVYSRELPRDTSQQQANSAQINGVNEKGLKAVMVWVHGGAFNRGSGGKDLNGPDFLLHGDVVVVTFNYRLALLGLANFDDPEIDVPGNALAKDVVKALEWVRENIVCFSGDPNNVTLFGESVGGTIIHVLSGCPSVRGLYHKIISQSSTAFFQADELACRQPKKTWKFAEALGFHGTSDREVYDFLMSQPAEKLVEASMKLLEINKNRYYRTLDVVMETPGKTEKPLITQRYDDFLLYSAHPNPVPLMIGSNSEDGMVHAVKPVEDRLIPPNFANPEELVPLYFQIPKDSDEAYEIGNRIQTFYYGREAPNRRNLQTYTKLQTDLKYRITTKRMVLAQKKFHPHQPIYLYRFSFESPYNLYKKFCGLSHLKGVCHGDELTYLLHTKYTPTFQKGSLEETAMLRLITLWTNFAKYSDPNPKDRHPLINATWKPTNAETLNHLDIGRDLKHVECQPDADRMKFWDDLHAELRVNWI